MHLFVFLPALLVVLTLIFMVAWRLWIKRRAFSGFCSNSLNGVFMPQDQTNATQSSSVQITLGNAVNISANPLDQSGNVVNVTNVTTNFTNAGVAQVISATDGDPLSFSLAAIGIGSTTLTVQANDDPANPNPVVVGTLDITVVAETVAFSFDVSDEFAIQPGAAASTGATATAASTGATAASGAAGTDTSAAAGAATGA
jgi:hypothetical protein